jgi:hypothetical protein
LHKKTNKNGCIFTFENSWIGIFMKELWTKKITNNFFGILGNLCHFHVVPIIIYKVYYRHESDDFSQVQLIVTHVSVFFPWFRSCTILIPIYTKLNLFWFV